MIEIQKCPKFRIWCPYNKYNSRYKSKGKITTDSLLSKLWVYCFWFEKNLKQLHEFTRPVSNSKFENLKLEINRIIKTKPRVANFLNKKQTNSMTRLSITVNPKYYNQKNIRTKNIK